MNIFINYSVMACADKTEGTNALWNKRIEHSYNRIQHHLRSFFSKQLEIYDYHCTLQKKECEEFLNDACLLKILIEKEKEKLKGCKKDTVHQNSDASDISGESDESWFDDDGDDISLYSTQCTGIEEKKEKEEVSFDNNMAKDTGEIADEVNCCAGIGQKDF